MRLGRQYFEERVRAREIAWKTMSMIDASDI